MPRSRQQTFHNRSFRESDTVRVRCDRAIAQTQFKRNQIEEAISRLFGEQSADPSSGVRTRIKRLLDLDRSLPRNARSKRAKLANYAFFDSDSPGKGAEVLFSEYEAFALLIGLQMLNHNWPQRFAVETLRPTPTRTPKTTQENSQSRSPGAVRSGANPPPRTTWKPRGEYRLSHILVDLV